MANIESNAFKKSPDRPGFCVDTGAPSSVVGIKELRRIFARLGRKVQGVRRSDKRFRFADAVFESLGKIDLPLETPPGVPTMYVTLDIVSADVPALLGLDVLDHFQMTPDTVMNRLVKRSFTTDVDGKKCAIDDWNVPMKRADGHLYVDMCFPVLTFFTTLQLKKLHRQFCHPSAEKLFNLLKRARPEDVTPDTMETLREISRCCEPCQRIQDGPARFRVSIGRSGARFNEVILLDIMFLNGKPVLHIVDDATRFSAARFLPDVSTRTVWATIVECWANLYTGLPNAIRVDQGSQFQDAFISVGRSVGIDIDQSGVESHNSLGVGERYHHPLRSTFRKLKLTYPTLSDSMLLSLSVKAMNDTLGPEGIVPSALVFGEYPSLRVFGETPQPRATVEARAIIAKEARQEMEQHMAKLRVKRALRHRIPRAADEVYEIGQQVLVWREKVIANRIGEWKGPYTVSGIDRDKKIIYVRDGSNADPKPFGLAQVKRYYSSTDHSNAFFSDLLSYFERYQSADDPSQIRLTEVLNPTDPRAQSSEMTEAKKKEIRSLLDRGTFKVIMKEDVPADGNVLPGRFVLAIKSSEDGEIKFKARYVIGGHRDKLKSMMVHSSQTLQPASIRLLLAMSSLHGFEVWTSDVRQAYLQSADPLSREVYIRDPVPEFELKPGECLQLLKPLYGLCESGDLWHKTLDEHHRNDLEMSSLRSDPALYSLTRDGTLHGLSGTYVGDMVRCGNSIFREIASKTCQRFEMGADEIPPCTFTGFHLSRDGNGMLSLDQHIYVQRLGQMDEDCTFSDFASLRMKLAWLSHSRPDVLFEVSQLTQVTVDGFNSRKAEIRKRANRTVQYVKDHRVHVLFPALDVETIHVTGYSDASFAANSDLSSQLGHIVMIGDSSGRVIPIHFKSYKARRIARSAMAAELIAFGDMFDIAHTLAEELRYLHPQATVPVRLYTDSKSLFDVISKGSRTSEKRLMLDIAAAREGFRKHEISDIGLVRTAHNIADGLTKAMHQSALRTVMCSGRLEPKASQWIVRSEAVERH